MPRPRTPLNLSQTTCDEIPKSAAMTIFRSCSTRTMIRQNGFFFSVNPLGAQSDLMLSNEGRTYNRDWDCNWTARTKHYPDRWTVEIEIPFSQLRFKQAADVTWGINLARYLARKNLATQLVAGQQTSSSTERYRMADIGELHGLQHIRARRPIYLKPYALPGTTIDDQATNPSEIRTIETGIGSALWHHVKHLARPILQHGFCTGRRRPGTNQPDAIPPLLPRKTRVLPRRRQPLPIWRTGARNRQRYQTAHPPFLYQTHRP